MSEPIAGNNENDLKKIDQEIEEDIKHLKRSSNFLAILGLLIIVIFVGLLGIKLLSIIGGGETNSAPSFIDVGIVTGERAAVYKDPMTTAPTLGFLESDSAIFILDDSLKEWYKIHAPIIIDNEITGKDLIGWISRQDIQTRSEVRKMRVLLSDRIEKTIDIIDVNWTIDEVGGYTISGKVVNLTKVPMKNVKVLITFYDNENQPVDRRYTFVAVDRPLRQDEPMPFVFIGRNEKDFNFVNCQVDYRIEED